jgi:L-alanine-DL-glutamate epimerase-like enolase superfamily enzyme
MTRPASQTRKPTHVVEHDTDVRVTNAELYLLPVETRMPLKFGPETLTSVTCARVRLEVRDRAGHTACGWGETPLSVQWAWPSSLSVADRHDAMVRFCKELATVWSEVECWGHPFEVGHAFLQTSLLALRNRFNDGRDTAHRMPLLASLVCLSAFDIALHDAYGVLHDIGIYKTYGQDWMNHDLSWYLDPATDSKVDFRGQYPEDFLARSPRTRLLAWHLVGGLDPLDTVRVTDQHIDDGLPITLTDWIDRDGLLCLKIKLRGNDSAWDYERIVRVGQIAINKGARSLSADFNCTVTESAYVNQILDRLATEHPDIHAMLLYIEQPFPYELADYPIDVRSLASRKALFMDESAHDWQQVRLGRALGWNGVALKTCKTQTGALLSLCWAKAHGMQVMVQDLTNPMLAAIPHALLAAHAETILGVETNAMQFYPQASAAEAAFHPGLYVRSNGHIDLTTVTGPGFGYSGAESARALPPPIFSQRTGVPSLVPRWHVG